MSDQLPAEIAEAIEALVSTLTPRMSAKSKALRIIAARAALDAAILKHIRVTDLGRSALAEEGRGT